MSDTPKLKKIKSGIFGRGAALAKLSLTGGMRTAWHRLSNLAADAEERKAALRELLLAHAKDLAAEFSQMKGSLMKAGQVFSIYGEYFLPAEVNDVLKSLQSQSASLEWSAIEDILQRELGAKLAGLEVEHEPIGAASLGQVHRARVRETGHLVAVKAQYPGVREAVDSDLRFLRGVLKAGNFIPGSAPLDALFEEARDMLYQELDYGKERLLTEAYATRLAGDARFVVPRTHADWCGPNLLVTTFEAGVAVGGPEVAALPQARRDRLGRNFLELLFREIFEFGWVQTDSHFGNYGVRTDERGEDRWVLYDFGAVRGLEPSFRRRYQTLVRAALGGGREATLSAARDLRIWEGDEGEELKDLLVELSTLGLEPFRPARQPYDWGASDLPDRLTATAKRLLLHGRARLPPREMIALDRKLVGTFILLARLGARIDGHALLAPYLARTI